MTPTEWLLGKLKFIQEQEDQPCSIEIIVSNNDLWSWQYHTVLRDPEIVYDYGGSEDMRPDLPTFMEYMKTARNAAVVLYYHDRPDFDLGHTTADRIAHDRHQIVYQLRQA